MACGRVWHVGSPSSAPRAPKHPWEETAKRITWHVCRKSIWSCFAATWGIAENFKAVSHKHPDAKTALGSYTARAAQHQPTCCCNGTKLLDLGSEEPLIYNSLLNWTLGRIFWCIFDGIGRAFMKRSSETSTENWKAITTDVTSTVQQKNLIKTKSEREECRTDCDIFCYLWTYSLRTKRNKICKMKNRED